MKKIVIILCMALGTMSCQNYLDIVPDNIATIDLAFNNRLGAKSFLYTCYNYLPDDGDITSNPALIGGDEMWLHPKGPDLSSFFGSTWLFDLANGEQNANNPIADFWTGDKQGKNLFIAIRDCNIFLDNIQRVPDIDDWEKKRWIAEVKFLKAYYHYYLLRMYGPTPIIDDNLPISASPDDVKVERQPVSKVVSYIVDLLDEAVIDLPLKIENETVELGRINQVIAYSIKAKVLVLDASPIFNRSGVFDDLLSSDGQKLIDKTEDDKKWVIAKEAVEMAIEKSHEAGIHLYTYKDSKVITDSTRYKMNIRGSFSERWNSEVIWGLTFTSTDHMQRLAQPRFNSAHISTHQVRNMLSPTMRMAELYYTGNGVPINEDVSWNFDERFKTHVAGEEDRYYIKRGYETANLNFDREPRFYGSLGFDGCIWYGNGKYDDNASYHLEMKARQFAGVMSSEKYNITGYLPKKYVNYENTIDGSGNYSIERYPFPVIRLADLYLLYAETANESGAEKVEVFKYLDLIRDRAGLSGVVESWSAYSNNPTKPDSKEGRRSIIKQERMIELAFEGQRFWDLRRWLDASDVMNEPIRGWNIREASTSDYYKVITLYDMKFNRKDYFWPIQTSEILINNKLVQNPGWK
ncbi:RagB/SusD family nutrient uptake outer membrane protein [Draconibacterium sediminis]|uniref:Carbohydrate-binding protein SusD n=1 Tax=Draconibacterium sediminis TaxID=1544798 RepID=A0A0D8JF80_9BACT|nr:RagB/SusD family nutrient uptake outer membrane protein [Draconibacterium sediminis]KJF45374.1 hypothetical protein LH29_08375 [Draconibacterium sediminis]